MMTRGWFVLLLQTLGLGLGLALERPGLGLGLKYQGLGFGFGIDTNGFINITGGRSAYLVPKPPKGQRLK